MHGPSTASTRVAPRRRMVVTVASTTPARSPRQPAWAMPTTPSGLARATGAQSAVSTARAAPREVVTAASAASPPAPPGPLHDDHPGPVHLVKHRPGQIDDGPAPALDRAHPSPPRSPWAHPVLRTRTPAGQLPVGRVRTGPGVHHPTLQKQASRTSRNDAPADGAVRAATGCRL